MEIVNPFCLPRILLRRLQPRRQLLQERVVQKGVVWRKGRSGVLCRSLERRFVVVCVVAEVVVAWGVV